MEPKQYILSECLSTECLYSYQMVSGDGGDYVVVNEEISDGILKYLEAKQLMEMCNNNKKIVCLICGGSFIVDGDLCRCYQVTSDCYNLHFHASKELLIDIESVFKKIKSKVKFKKLGETRVLLEASACGSSSTIDLGIIYKLQAGLCYYCMSPIYVSGHSKYTVDHIVPLSSGGSSWPGNIALTCKSCNSKKSWTAESIFIKKIRRNKSVAWIDEHKEFISFIKRHKRKEFPSRSDSKA
jgi:hypothetical protein